MSIELMSQVWKYDLSHAEQSILMALADHADDHGGSVYPSIAYVAWKTNYKERNVQLVMKDLRKRKILVVVARPTQHKPTEYRIDLSKAKTKPLFLLVLFFQPLNTPGFKNMRHWC
jgi:hypothetical protein